MHDRSIIRNGDNFLVTRLRSLLLPTWEFFWSLSFVGQTDAYIIVALFMPSLEKQEIESQRETVEASLSKQGLTFDAEKFKFVQTLRVYKAHLTLQSAELKTEKIVSPYLNTTCCNTFDCTVSVAGPSIN